MKKFNEILEDLYASDYKQKEFMGPDGKWHVRKLRPHRVDFKASKMRGEPAQKDSGDDVGMKEEKTTGATKLVHTRTGANGVKYHIMQDSPTDYSVHREHGGKTTHIDTYSSLHRAKSVLDNEVKEEVQIDEAGYGRNRGYAHGFASPHAPSLGGRREREDDEGWDREPKQADHPHAVHINGKKWKSFGSQSHAQNVAKKIKGATVHREETDMNIDDQINEVLSKDATAGDWIHDFVHSDNPKFAGKSKDKRKQMALAAYYAKQRNEEVELEENAPVAPVPDRKYIKGTPENKAYKASKKPINGHPTNVKEGTMKSFREVMQSIQEANHRDFASQGLMHPNMAKNMKTGQETDFYHSKTGDKISGIVKKNIDGEVHIQANKDGKMGGGDVHKFKVSSNMNEALVGGQKNLDKNKNGKLDSSDFKMLRGETCPECGKSPCECGHVKEEKEKYAGLEAMKKMGLPTAARSSHPKGVNIDTVEGWDHPHDAVKKKEVKEESETRTVSFKDFINEIKMADLPKRTVKGTSYGAQYRDPEGEDDADDKKKQVAKPEPAVKRGRGRPAGSKSGANQKVTSGTKRSGVDYSGYKLHLPNTNR